MDDAAWCGRVNLRDPTLVRMVHEDHIRAGADVVISNTFMSGLGPMRRAGATDSEFELGLRNAVVLESGLPVWLGLSLRVPGHSDRPAIAAGRGLASARRPDDRGAAAPRRTPPHCRQGHDRAPCVRRWRT